MKALLLSLMFFSSFNLFAETCNLSQTEARREEIDEIFSSGHMNGEDLVINHMNNDREEGKDALECIKRDIVSGYTARSLEFALRASENELEEEVQYLEEMIAHYEARGNYLMIDQIREEIVKVESFYNKLNQKIKNLL